MAAAQVELAVQVGQAVLPMAAQVEPEAQAVAPVAQGTVEQAEVSERPWCDPPLPRQASIWEQWLGRLATSWSA
jgi:hypothetical protein